MVTARPMHSRSEVAALRSRRRRRGIYTVCEALYPGLRSLYSLFYLPLLYYQLPYHCGCTVVLSRAAATSTAASHAPPRDTFSTRVPCTAVPNPYMYGTRSTRTSTPPPAACTRTRTVRERARGKPAGAGRAGPGVIAGTHRGGGRGRGGCWGTVMWGTLGY